MSWPSPIIEPRFSYRAEDVVQSLEPICCSNGYPKTIRVDQGSEFVSREMDLWAYANGVALDSPVPASQLTMRLLKPSTDGSGPQCLNAHWFLTLDDARSKMEDWRKYYNEVRPHAARRPAVAAGPQVEETSLWIGPLKGTRGLHRMAIFVSEASGYRGQPIPMKLLTFEVFWPGL